MLIRNCFRCNTDARAEMDRFEFCDHRRNGGKSYGRESHKGEDDTALEKKTLHWVAETGRDGQRRAKNGRDRQRQASTDTKQDMQ